MTTYFFAGSTGGNIAIQAVGFEIKLLRLDVYNYYASTPGSYSSIYGTVERTTTTVLSGGTAGVAGPSRGATIAATAICKTGSVNTTGSGSNEVVAVYNATQQSLTPFSFPVDIIIPIGKAIIVGGATGVNLNFYFEELRLSWPK